MAVLLAVPAILLLPGELATEARGSGGGSAPAAPLVAGAASPPGPRADVVLQGPRGALQRDLRIVAGGDILIHEGLWEQAAAAAGPGGGYDFRFLFRHVRPILRRADLALCHLETPLAPGPPSSYPVFGTPPELATAIAWAGWDACSTASNHSVDRGQDGVDSTLRALDRAGVAHAGTHRSARHAGRITVLEADGVRVAFLAYTFSLNGFAQPSPWTANIGSEDRIRADARRARRMGADLVIANVHWGTEYSHTPNSQQTSVSRALLRDHVVDVLLGQHAHVVQPIERIARGYVVYGEGNLVSGQGQPERRDGYLAVIRVHADGDGVRVVGVDYVPTWVSWPDHVVEPVGRELDRLQARGLAAGALAAELRASYLRTVGVVGSGSGFGPIPRRIG